MTSPPPGPNLPAAPDEDILNARVVQRIDPSSHVCILRVAPVEGPAPAIRAGQFISLGLPRRDQPVPPDGRVRMLRRPYSIASAEQDRDALEFFVARVDDGRLTQQLWAFGPGDRLWMDQRVLGDFTLDRAPADADVVFVATGTGLAPFLSMLRSDVSLGTERRAVLVHGVRQPSDLGYAVELADLARGRPRFLFAPFVSRPQAGDGWSGAVGRVQRALTEGLLDRWLEGEFSPERSHVFLCGNPEMIRSMTQLLAERGFALRTRVSPTGTVHVERYW